MGTISRGIRLGRQVVALFAIALLTFTMASCAKPVQPTELISAPTPQANRLTGQIAEVSPPATLETLKQIIDAYTPQVRLLSPRPGEVLKDTTVTVRFQVRGLPIFKDDTYQLGPHLHLFLDNEPYKAVYDLSESITFENLSPGTHTLRVFASRPWHESFKNQGAFDQRTFHVVAPTPQNELDTNTPLLTYSRPQGSYGAEPIMLDFYLTNAPLHMSAQVDPNDDLHDWRIRCTVNEQSFVFDQWQPIWLKGFKPGRNWVQLELIDEGGNPIDNRFNNTVRIIDYQPGGSDTLSQLVRGEVTLNEIAGVIDPTYEPPIPSEPEPSVPETEADVPEDSPPAEALPQPSALEEPTGVEAVPIEPVEPATAPDSPEAALDESEGLGDRPVDSSSSVDATPDTEIQPNLVPRPEASLEPGVSPASPPEEEVVPESQAAAEPEDDVAETADFSTDDATSKIEDDAEPSPSVDIAPPPGPSATPGSDPAPSLGVAPEKPTSKGLVDRFKQWRGSGEPKTSSPALEIPEPLRNEPEVIPEELTAPEGGKLPAETATPDLPETIPEDVDPSLTEPYLASPRSLEAAPQESLPDLETEPAEESDDLDEPESVYLPDLPEAPPRSPLASEARPFI